MYNFSRCVVKQTSLGFGLGRAAHSHRSRLPSAWTAACAELPVYTNAGSNSKSRTERKDSPFWLPPTDRPFNRGGPALPPLLGGDYAFRIDGKSIAESIRKLLSQEVSWMREQVGFVPGIAMVRVGDRKDSELYVRGKQSACAEVGINSFVTHMPTSTSESEVLELIDTWNSDPRIHGILVQLPLPKHIKKENILRGVSLEKDVDGLHPTNLERLFRSDGSPPTFLPCTPRGCMELLAQLGVQLEGKHAVVIGCSSVVGFPTALLLRMQKADVTIVEIDTPNPAELSKKADILIAAAGVPKLVRGNWLKPGAVVIDVGISAVKDPEMESGFRVIGDVCFEEAEKVAGAITPVPGGVGPMTIAMLLSNTLKAAERSLGLKCNLSGATKYTPQTLCRT